MMRSLWTRLRLRKTVSLLLAALLLLSPVSGWAQPVSGLVPTAPVALPAPVLSGVSVDERNPLRFSFWVDEGDTPVPEEERNAVYTRLVKDFMTALTIPEESFWVNLSPYESDRIIDEPFGRTETGRDLLEQDYTLKQLSASLLSPEAGPGKAFWERIYAAAGDAPGIEDVPMDTFHKVWIVPGDAVVVQDGLAATVESGRLDVMLEEDYVAREQSVRVKGKVSGPGKGAARSRVQDVLREVLLPELDRRVNGAPEFARLRQVYRALVLAAWYRKTLRDTVLGRAYVDRAKTKGIDQSDPSENRRIYERYVEAFRRGAYSFIREDVDRNSGEIIPRRYFSGGVAVPRDFAEKHVVIRDAAAQTGPRKGPRQKEIDQKMLMVQMTPRSGDEEALLRPVRAELQEIYSFSSILAGIEERHRYALPADLRKQRDFLERKIEGLFFKALDRLLEGHNQRAAVKQFLRESIVNGEWSGLREMILRGAYPEQILKQAVIMAWLADQQARPVSPDNVFLQLGLRPGLLEGTALRIAPSADTPQLISFYDKTMQFLQGTLTEKQSLFLQDEVDAFPGFIKTCRVSGGWVSHNTDQSKVIRSALGMAYALLPKVYKHLQTKIGRSNPMFFRVKEQASLQQKLAFELGRDGEPLMLRDVDDLIGARVVFPDLMTLERVVTGLRARESKAGCLVRSKPFFKRNWQQRRSYAAVHLLLRVPERLYNLTRATDKNGKMHKGWISEIQFKSLGKSIASDLDHRALFKADAGLPQRLVTAIDQLNWYVNIVDMLNYMYDHPAIGPDKVSAFLGSIDKAAADARIEDTGGIDARNVEARLTVRGAGAAVPRWAELSVADLAGLEPVVLSIKANALADGR